MSEKRGFRRFLNKLTGSHHQPSGAANGAEPAVDPIDANGPRYSSSSSARSNVVSAVSPRPSNVSYNHAPPSLISADNADPNLGTLSSTSSAPLMQQLNNLRASHHSNSGHSHSGRRRSNHPSVTGSQSRQSHASRNSRNHQYDAMLDDDLLYRLCYSGTDNDMAVSILHDFDLQRGDGWPMMLQKCVLITAMTDNTQLMTELVYRGGSVGPEVRSGEHETVLHLASTKNRVTMVDWLVHNNPSLINCKDAFGQTADQVADVRGYRSCAAVIIAARNAPPSTSAVTFCHPPPHDPQYYDHDPPNNYQMYGHLEGQHQQHHQQHHQQRDQHFYEQQDQQIPCNSPPHANDPRFAYYNQPECGPQVPSEYF